MQLSVLVAITTYNHVNYTAAALQSVLKNTDEFDVIVIDDMREDDTVTYVRSKGLEVVALDTPAGTTRAWNEAYRFALRHDYDILFISNNDVLIPSGAVRFMQEELELGSVGIAVPLTSLKGAGFNPAQSVTNFDFESHGQRLSFTESELKHSVGTTDRFKRKFLTHQRRYVHGRPTTDLAASSLASG